MKRFVALLCLLLFLCGCSADPFAQKGGEPVSYRQLASVVNWPE